MKNASFCVFIRQNRYSPSPVFSSWKQPETADAEPILYYIGNGGFLQVKIPRIAIFFANFKKKIFHRFPDGIRKRQVPDLSCHSVISGLQPTRLMKNLKAYFLIRNHNQTCNYFVLSDNSLSFSEEGTTAFRVRFSFFGHHPFPRTPFIPCGFIIAITYRMPLVLKGRSLYRSWNLQIIFVYGVFLSLSARRVRRKLGKLQLPHTSVQAPEMPFSSSWALPRSPAHEGSENGMFLFLSPSPFSDSSWAHYYSRVRMTRKVSDWFLLRPERT